MRLWNRQEVAVANVQQMQSDGRVISVKSVVPMVLMEPMTVTACLVGKNAVEVTLMPGGPPKTRSWWDLLTLGASWQGSHRLALPHSAFRPAPGQSLSVRVDKRKSGNETRHLHNAYDFEDEVGVAT